MSAPHPRRPILDVTHIFHVTRSRDWHHAQAAGTYQLSTRDRTLDDVGFIHYSYAHQVAGVANAIYKGEPDLVRLVIDVDRLNAPLQPEPPPLGLEPYPHVYGALNLDAVMDVVPYRLSADGTFGPPSIS